MLEVVKYQNHLGEEINFSENGIYVKSSDLHDYAWNYIEKGGKIAAFRRKIINKKIEIHISCDTESAGIEKRNQLTECFEKDILVQQPGKIIVNGSFLNCYVLSSSKSSYLTSKKTMIASLELLSDDPIWRTAVQGIVTMESASLGQLTNPLQNAADFRIEIQGVTYNPTSVTIGGVTYGVQASLQEGETLVIDSALKQVYKQVSGSAEKQDMYSKRLRSDYKDRIFTPIPAGSSEVRKSYSFDWTIDLYEERSEPKWI